MSDSPSAAHILVVDDVEDNRDLLARRVRRQGHTVTTAVNGQAALELLETESFDVVLLDIQMPIMDGFELLRRMKADEQLRSIPVIIVSATDEEDSAVECIRLGAEDFLPKPFNAVLLKARMDACLVRKRMHDSEADHRRQLDAERQRADELLHALFPKTVVDELKADGMFRPRRYADVAILFADIAEFTPYCDRRDPAEVVQHLQRLVEEFEGIARDTGLEKIKTVGDSFMAAANLVTPAADPVGNCLAGGRAMIRAALRLPPHWQLRVGIHVGPVVAGIVGTQKYSFDVWGDTVNTARRVEETGSTGAVNLSRTAWLRVADRCTGETRSVELKGKGLLDVVVVSSEDGAASSES